MGKNIATSAADVWRLLGEVTEVQKRNDTKMSELLEAQKRTHEPAQAGQRSSFIYLFIYLFI